MAAMTPAAKLSNRAWRVSIMTSPLVLPGPAQDQRFLSSVGHGDQDGRLGVAGAGLERDVQRAGGAGCELCALRGFRIRHLFFIALEGEAAQRSAGAVLQYHELLN